MDTQFTIQYFIEHEREGTYFTLPFTMPPNTEVFSLSYYYERHHEGETRTENGSFTSRKEINIIDLGILAPDGTQVGASGSDKTSIFISETSATPGYQRWPLAAGEWKIIAGAYKVAPQGVQVRYELRFTSKHMRLLKGDLHAHTLASDGVLTAGELGQRAVRHDLDFLAVTDHNQMVSAESLPQIPGITLIPGIEWTHFKGHANFLGVGKPYDEPFFTTTLDDVKARFNSAHERGALITINHPFEEVCPFCFDINSLPFDCLEIWNGPMRESNLRAVGLWQNLLMSGRKIPISGGSDYHRDQLFLFPGGPTMCVFAKSNSVTDILSALKEGHAYITFAPNGPALELTAGDCMMGDSVQFPKIQELNVSASGLLAGDVVQVVTGKGSFPLLKAESDGRMQTAYRMESPGFAWVQILRSFLPGLPMLPALISNPIYFDA